MLFKVGDIIVVKGTIFKENGWYDTRIYGRPVLILDSNNEVFYYLTMSTKRVDDDEMYQYFYVKHKAGRKCYINCKSIYKKEAEFHTVRDTLYDEQLEALLEKFIHYQEQVEADEFYNEIKDNVKKYIKQR